MIEPTVSLFIDSINRKDLDSLAKLMTEDHVFVDSLGERLTGRDTMRAGWANYFTFVPDYRIMPDWSARHGNAVAVFGTTEGTYAPDGKIRKENYWITPAAFRVMLRGEQIQMWQVYADNKRMHELLAAGH